MTLGIAVLGFWHVHADEYAAAARDHSGTHLAGIWDREAERGRLAAQERGVPFVGDLHELLANPEVDGVIVSNETTEHTAVILAAIEVDLEVAADRVLGTRGHAGIATRAQVEVDGIFLHPLRFERPEPSGQFRQAT